VSENNADESATSVEHHIKIEFERGWHGHAYRRESEPWHIGGAPVESETLCEILNTLWRNVPLNVKRSKVTTVERTEELP